MTMHHFIGASPRRRVDARFVPGHGAYLADLAFADLAHAVLLAPCGVASADRRRQSFDMSPHGRASRGIYQIDESK